MAISEPTALLSLQYSLLLFKFTCQCTYRTLIGPISLQELPRAHADLSRSRTRCYITREVL